MVDIVAVAMTSSSGMDFFEELCRWTDCKVAVSQNGRAVVLNQAIVERIQDELGGDPDFEVRPRPQHMRDLPGRRLVYDEVKITMLA
jgi:hypothetical protein